MIPQKILIILSFFLFAAPFGLLAQSNSSLALSRYNWTIINPAALEKAYLFNESERWQLQTAHRQSAIGLQNAPNLSFLAVDFKPVTDREDEKESVGHKFGFALLRDKFGAFHQIQTLLNYAIYLPLGSERFFHIGISGSFLTQQLNVTRQDFKIPEPKAPLLQNEDAFQANVGIYYRHLQRFYTGFSAPQRVKKKIKRGERTSSNLPRTISYYWISGGFIDLKRGKAKNYYLEPTLVMRYTPDVTFQRSFVNQPFNNPFSSDLTFRAHFLPQRFAVGVGYSTNGYTQTEFNFRFGDTPNLTCELAYQFSTRQRTNFGSSFEVRVLFAIE
ncbi:MAG: PorP/SprF family type IX secretion system membrane protein [Bacteroidota bacterium]